MPLFPSSIQRVRDFLDRKQVTVPHTNEAIYLQAPDGAVWIGKSAAHIGVNGLLSEAASWLISRDVGAPVPEAALLADRSPGWWLSRVVPNVVHWRADQVARIENIEELGNVLVVDVLVMNADRHSGNLLLESRSESGQLRLWAIDYDDALIGHPDDFAAAESAIPSVKNLARGIPIELVLESARATAQKAASTTAGRIRAIVDEACSIAQEPRVDEVSSVLRSRFENAVELVERYLKAVEEMSG